MANVSAGQPGVTTTLVPVELLRPGHVTSMGEVDTVRETAKRIYWTLVGRDFEDYQMKGSQLCLWYKKGK